MTDGGENTIKYLKIILTALSRRHPPNGPGSFWESTYTSKLIMSEFHNVHDWVQRQRELLELEKGEEMAMLQSKLSSLSAKECEEEGL